ncbi:MAG: nuclear transport factor 2 family protein [Bacteroidota bacterium]
MKEVIESFYTAFQRMDAETMVALYHDDIVFSDPAFGELRGERAKNMWRMLIKSQEGKDFRVEFSDLTDNSAHWEAFYNFGKAENKVHNKIEANFRFQDGKIIEHLDSFNLHKWAGQAVGLQGKLLGWTGFFRKQLHQQTHRMLDKFESSNA